ncbi:hypothetical protein [Actinosynnema sp. NPDC023587]|uniref:hypothetical protein n=1 Tax=Actinosynnema sp. NPDC023587 TaxID=3154695 RepID=UPI0033F5E163
MTTETEHPTWGGQPPPQAAPGPRWSGRKTVVAAAIAVGIAAAGGGVIYAASNSEAAQSGTGGPRGGGPGMMITGGPFGDTAHGEFQNGEVTELDDSSITVKSTDGHTRTYKIDENTTVNGTKGTAGLAKGDTVLLVATEGTATGITEGDRVRRGDRPQPPGGQDDPGAPDGEGDEPGQPPTR